jgi:hypothetical protein
MELLIYPVIFYIAKSLLFSSEVQPPHPLRVSPVIVGSGGNGEDSHA